MKAGLQLGRLGENPRPSKRHESERTLVSGTVANLTPRKIERTTSDRPIVVSVNRSFDEESEPSFWRRRSTSWVLAGGISTLLHSGLLIALAFVWTLLPQEVRDSAIDSLFVAETPDEPLVELVVEPEVRPQNTATAITSGGQTSAIFTASSREAASSLAPPRPKPSLVAAVAESDWVSAHAGEAVSLSQLSSESDGSVGTGNGSGDSTGDGDGGSFFGLTPEGRRFVFVIDCSRSMNHPHGSEAKTRFKRMKIELTKTVFSLGLEQEFFFIFFNDQAIPMPAAGVAQANPVTKERYLGWMLDLKADGDTEPTGALQLALRLNPDVIYFLTDGSFIHRVQTEMLSLRTGSTRIHTFAFEEKFVTDERQRAYELLESGDASAARRAAGSKRAFDQVLEIWRSHYFLIRFAAQHHGKFKRIPYDG
jgi:hypothetical protein